MTHIRLATPDDAAAVLAIYAPIVRDTATSFELEPPDVDEMGRRIDETLKRFPWLVYENEQGVGGYAYAGTFRSRPAYQWTVEVSVYVREDVRGQGIGRALYESLFDRLRTQGYRNAVAGIALPNPASIRLHERLGFRKVGVFHRVGYKFGAWHDVSWWELPLNSSPDRPTAPLPRSADAVRRA
jgi:phosphinothricin acetyltransferase